MSSGLRLISVVLVLAATLSSSRWGADAGPERRGQEPPQTASPRPPDDSTRESLAVIVNRTNPVADLSFDEWRQVFLGERTRWPNGRRVHLVMSPTARPEREAVLRIVYEMREQDFHAHFLRAKFTGEVLEEPRMLDTPTRVINFVFLQPGAIGYVRAGEVGPSVKVISVDGLRPGEAGYKLTL